MSSARPAPSAPARSPWAIAAAAVLVVETIFLVALIVAYVIGISRHDESDLGRTLASIGLFLVGAAILVAMVRGWLRAESWPRMATLVLNALLVPVGFSLIRGPGLLAGLPVLALAATGVVAAISAGPQEGSQRD